MGRAIVIACAVLLAAGAGCAETPEDSAKVADEPAPTEAETSETTTTTRPRPTTTTTRPPTTTTTTTTTAPPTTTTTTTAPPPPTTTAPPPPPTTAAPVAPAGGGCTPGYDPCVPVASDVDCAGGSGDGPEYVDGPISVTGSDPYDLDRDGNGVGCES
jgi:hypothetical protein